MMHGFSDLVLSKNSFETVARIRDFHLTTRGSLRCTEREKRDFNKNLLTTLASLEGKRFRVQPNLERIVERLLELYLLPLDDEKGSHKIDYPINLKKKKFFTNLDCILKASHHVEKILPCFDKHHNFDKFVASVFQFDNRVTTLEKEVAELKRNDPLNTQVTALVDEHLDSRLGATRDEFMSYL
ncbi:hypothetical protein Tco_0690728 [Tanacetum coccineum]